MQKPNRTLLRDTTDKLAKEDIELTDRSHHAEGTYPDPQMDYQENDQKVGKFEISWNLISKINKQK